MQIIRQRRSGQRFDPKCTLDKAAFYRMLDATLPRPLAPFTAQEADPAIHLLLFVLRVDGLPPASTCCRARRLRRPPCPENWAKATTASPAAARSPTSIPIARPIST
jgi:hypothetical protein